MPELTEVEAFAQAMTRWCGGRRVTALQLLDPTVQHTVERDVVGMTVRRVWRRGKHLILSLQRYSSSLRPSRLPDGAWSAPPHLSMSTHASARRAQPGAVLRRYPTSIWTSTAVDDAELMIHLRMTGQLLPGEGAAFVRFVLHVQDASPVQLIDPRRLAELHVLAPGGAARRLSGLGDEPFPARQPGPWWQERLGHTRRPLKAALMDQTLVAGLGNIAASEILWRAKLHPARAASGLSAPEWSSLATAAHEFLHTLMGSQDPERLVYINRGGENPFSVYQKTRCPRCEGAVGRLTQQGRSTYFCPDCQPWPGG